MLHQPPLLRCHRLACLCCTGAYHHSALAHKHQHAKQHGSTCQELDLPGHQVVQVIRIMH